MYNGPMDTKEIRSRIETTCAYLLGLNCESYEALSAAWRELNLAQEFIRDQMDGLVIGGAKWHGLEYLD